MLGGEAWHPGAGLIFLHNRGRAAGLGPDLGVESRGEGRAAKYRVRMPAEDSYHMLESELFDTETCTRLDDRIGSFLGSVQPVDQKRAIGSGEAGDEILHVERTKVTYPS